MERNQSRGPGIIPGLAVLEDLQRHAPKGTVEKPSADEWWTRPYLWTRVKTKLSRKDYENALAAIRSGAPGWHYKRAGRDAAFCLALFIELLPERFRPKPEEKKALLDGELRRHVLDTIETGLREYHAAASKPDPGAEGNVFAAKEMYEAGLRAATDPYYELLISLHRSGRLRLPAEIVPIREDREDERTGRVVLTEEEAMNAPGVSEIMGEYEASWQAGWLLRVQAWLLIPEAPSKPEPSGKAHRRKAPRSPPTSRR